MGASNGDEADNHRHCNFSAFAKDFNLWVSELSHNEKPQVTYKTASHLQDAYDIKKKRANASASRRPHVDNLTTLQEQLRDETVNETYENEFVQPIAPSLACPPSARRVVEQRNVEIQTEGDLIIEDEFFDSIMENHAEVPKRKRRRRNKTHKPRCRQCGQCYTADEWRSLHEFPTQNEEDLPSRKQNRYLLNRFKAHQHCAVPESQYEDGFPCLPITKKMPRRNKNKKTVENEESS